MARLQRTREVVTDLLMDGSADALFEKETGIRVMRRTSGHRVAPALPGSPAEPSRLPAQVDNRTAALEAELERLSTASQRLAAENERLKLQEADRAHEMTVIRAGLQRAWLHSRPPTTR